MNGTQQCTRYGVLSSTWGRAQAENVRADVMETHKERLRSWTSSGEGLVDFRPESEFYIQHIRESTSIPWSELKIRGRVIL
jgi:hypothetical protein